MSAGRPWLVVAISGRALAASAARGGHRTIVLDCFADRDTRASAVETRGVAAPGAPRIHHAALRAALRALRDTPVAGVVCGSGFEANPAWIARLARERMVRGNGADTVALVKDPARFFPLLHRLGIAHPETRIGPPDNPAGWLRKRTGGAGGTHVRRATRHGAARGTYFQRELPGRTLSAVFLADGERARLVGVNEQWTAPAPGLPFLYGGAVSRPEVPAGLWDRLDELLARLVPAAGLVGLNGLDFLLQGGMPCVLEVNPRPTATLDLHDPDWPRGLFDAHLVAAGGELPAGAPASGPARAAATVFAPADWTCPDAAAFPAWCTDLPMPGTHCRAGAPICTVHAEATTATTARALVGDRQRQLVDALMPRAPAVTP